MIRIIAALLCGLLLGAAAPALPLPPLPPAHPPTDQAAPVPNVDVRAPQTVVLPHTAVGVRVFRMPGNATGLAFIPGSAYDSPEDRRPVQTPGITVSVPMQ